MKTQSQNVKKMDNSKIDNLFTQDVLDRLFPAERSNEFFDALFGDADEGAYDIRLGYDKIDGDKLTLDLELHERPGKCLACNLTQGLPSVFSRHPVININGLVEDIDELLGNLASCKEWSLGYTEQRKKETHVIPIHIILETT